MKKTLIWEAVHGLSKKDRVGFAQFMHSPYFNRREELANLADFLLSEDVIGDDTITKRTVFYAVYPQSETFNDQKLRLLLSYLNKSLETFLAVDEFQKAGGSSWVVLSALQKRNLRKNYVKRLKALRTKQQKEEKRDWAYYLDKYRVELQDLDSALSPTRKEDFNFEELTNSLDVFYLIAKLRHACTALLYQSVVNNNYQFPLLDDVLVIAAQERYLKIPAIAIYYHFLKVMTAGEDVDFVKLKEELFTQKNALSEKEFLEAYTMILNFYIRELNRHRPEFFPEVLDFYKKGLELGLLLENGYLSRFKYSNIVVSGLQVGQLEWTSAFIDEYKPLLRKEIRKDTYCLNRARLEYALHHYDEALELIREVKHDELFYAITVRILQIKIFWETSELGLLDHQLYSLKVYLKRKKIIGYHNKLWSNIIKYTRKLTEVNRYDADKIEKLKIEIQNEETLTEKAWLLEQLELLRAKQRD